MDREPRIGVRAAIVRRAAAASADAAMARYSLGDLSAFKELYDALAAKLYVQARARTRDASSARDLVQETLLIIHNARERFRPGAEVAPWACTILNRLIIGQFRRKKWEVVGADESSVHPLQAEGASPEDGARSAECQRLFLQAWERLSAPQREATRLICEREMSWQEAAQALGTSQAAVKLRVSRAKRAIRSRCGAV